MNATAQSDSALCGLLAKYREESKSDLFFFIGPISSETVRRFSFVVMSEPSEAKKVTLALTTWGGDAHAAYRMVRFLRSGYQKVRLLVMGPCKSAGTLVAVGAHEVAFGPWGELGPLDLQMNRPDEMWGLRSGLDTLQGLANLDRHALVAFQRFMIKIIEMGQGAISTKAAADMASELAVGLFSPIAAQIDPHEIGEVERGMDIARKYGERVAVNLQDNALERLVADYPSHGFVIDRREASEIFKEISNTTALERQILVGFLGAKTVDGLMLDPPDDDKKCLIFNAYDLISDNEEGQSDEQPQPAKGDGASAGPDAAGGPGPNGPAESVAASRPTGVGAAQGVAPESGIQIPQPAKPGGSGSSGAVPLG